MDETLSARRQTRQTLETSPTANEDSKTVTPELGSRSSRRQQGAERGNIQTDLHTNSAFPSEPRPTRSGSRGRSGDGDGDDGDGSAAARPTRSGSRNRGGDAADSGDAEETGVRTCTPQCQGNAIRANTPPTVAAHARARPRAHTHLAALWEIALALAVAATATTTERAPPTAPTPPHSCAGRIGTSRRQSRRTTRRHDENDGDNAAATGRDSRSAPKHARTHTHTHTHTHAPACRRSSPMGRAPRRGSPHAALCLVCAPQPQVAPRPKGAGGKPTRPAVRSAQFTRTAAGARLLEGSRHLERHRANRRVFRNRDGCVCAHGAVRVPST